MSENDEQDRLPYRNAPLDGSTQQRKGNTDARINEGGLIGYMGPDGKTYAWTGDREAPYVKLIQQAPALVAVSLIPTGSKPSFGVLIASVIASELHEVWATDERDPLTNPPARWLLLFDRQDLPAAGDQPIVAPLRLCGTASYDFIEAPMQFNSGIVVAISTTPNIYTQIAGAIDFAITARVLARS